MELVAFSGVDRSALRWLRTSEEPAGYQLLSGDLPVATLAWQRRAGSLATGTYREGSWTFKRTGFLSPSIEVRATGSDRPIARLVAHLRHHAIRIGSGAPFTLVHASRLLPSWRVLRPDGTELLHIEPIAERGSLRGGAVVVTGTDPGAETLLLASLAWYFVVLVWIEDELVEAFTSLEGWGPGSGTGQVRPEPSPTGAGRAPGSS